MEKIDSVYSDDDLLLAKERYPLNPPLIKESLYFREIFDKYYKGRDNVIPHYWLPKWSGNLVNPSARLLAIYKNDDEE